MTRLWKNAQEANLINHPDWPDLFYESRLKGRQRPDFLIPDVHCGDFLNSCLNQKLEIWNPTTLCYISTKLGDLFGINVENAKDITHLVGDFGTYCDLETHSLKCKKYCSRVDTFLFLVNTGYWPYGEEMVHQDKSYPRSLVVRAELAAIFFQFQKNHCRTVSKVCSWTREHNIQKLKDLAEQMIAENPNRDSGLFELHQEIEKIYQEGYKKEERTERVNWGEELDGKGFFDGLEPEREKEINTEKCEPELDEEEQEYEKELDEIEEDEWEEDFLEDAEEESEENSVDDIDDENYENPEKDEEEAEDNPDEEDEWYEGGEGGF